MPQRRPAALARRPAPRRVPQQGGVRLTLRGRIVLALLLVGLAVATVALTAAVRAQAASSGSAPAAVDRSMTQVVVQPGQTLWSIAVRADPKADPRAVVQQIADINALPGVSIQPGQQLWVPKG